MNVVSKGRDHNNKELFLITLENGITLECTETYRYVNRFNRFHRVKAARMGENKIQAIKEIQDNLGLGLKDSKDLVESLWR